MNTNFFVAEDEAFNPNKVLTRKEMDAFIGNRGIKSYAGVLKKDNRCFTIAGSTNGTMSMGIWWIPA